MAVVSLAGLLLGGAPAGAQSSTALASNFSKANGKTFGFGHEYGQSFTTRSNAAGYRLTALKLDVSVGNPQGNQPNYRIELWSMKNSLPHKGLKTLTNPSAITNGVNTWTFPEGGYDVKADTTYVVLWDVFDPVGSISALFQTTAVDSEDAGSWPIGNSAFMKTKSATSWSTNDEALQIQILGYAKTAPTAAPVQTQPPPPDPPNLARGDIQPVVTGGAPSSAASDRVGLLGAVNSRKAPGGRPGIHQVPVQISEIRSNQPSGATGSLDLRAIAASVSEELHRHSRGFYLTVMVERISGHRHLFRSGSVLDGEGRSYELARGAPLLKVRIWHVYYHSGRGMNTVELLGEVFGGRPGDRLAKPVEVCLPAPASNVERAQIAARGRLDRYWTILESYLTFDGQICAETVRVSWFTIVLEPESEHRAA
ncbi:MAG: hypothetical protein OXN86_09405 [Chloroflexota bacterium]|nr:hypothetical protein [Chloroflexota bacterium]